MQRQEVKDTLRLALQAAVSAFVMVVLMHALGLHEVFVGVLSAVLVVQPSIGSTIGEGSGRVVATLVGSGLGLLTLVLLPPGWGVAAALAVTMFVLHLVAGWRPEWRYGVVAAVALSLGSNGDPWQTAFDRGLAIAIGAGVGILVTLVVWPDTAPKRARRHLARALRAAGDRLDLAVRGTLGDEHGDTEAKTERGTYHRAISDAREAARAVRLGDNDHLLERIDRTERFYNSVLMVNRVAHATDDLGEWGSLRERVERLRERGCRLAHRLADGETDCDSLEAMREDLEAVRETVAAAGDEDARRHVLGNALVFGLGEVYESLAALSAS